VSWYWSKHFVKPVCRGFGTEGSTGRAPESSGTLSAAAHRPRGGLPGVEDVGCGVRVCRGGWHRCSFACAAGYHRATGPTRRGAASAHAGAIASRVAQQSAPVPCSASHVRGAPTMWRTRGGHAEEGVVRFGEALTRHACRSPLRPTRRCLQGSLEATRGTPTRDGRRGRRASTRRR
jgi:hypothetical protein